MIDFKYHVISIVAVFLALAVGIVVGTNVLSGDVLDNLKSQTSQLRSQAQDLRTQVDQQQGRVADARAFDQALEPIVVAGRLSGLQVVVVALPGTSKDLRDSVVKTLGEAGATVTTEVDLDQSYTDPASAVTLDALATSVVEPTVDLASAKTPAARAAAVLAAALVAPPEASGFGAGLANDQGPLAATTPGAAATPTSTGGASPSPTSGGTSPATTPAGTVSGQLVADGGPPAITPASVTALAGFEKAGFVKLSQEPDTFAGAAVVLSPAAPAQAASPAAAADTALLGLVSALSSAGGQTLVAGPAGSTDAGGFVAELRGSTQLTRKVSAVDDADTAAGRIALVFALANQVAGHVGQYGTGQGATAPLPSPA